MAEEGKGEEKLEFTPEGEALGYISSIHSVLSRLRASHSAEKMKANRMVEYDARQERAAPVHQPSSWHHTPVFEPTHMMGGEPGTITNGCEPGGSPA